MTESQELKSLACKLMRAASNMDMAVKPVPKRSKREILVECATLHLHNPDAVRGPSRARTLFRPRAKAMLAMKREGYSYPQIGLYFERHHTSVMWACERALLWERQGQ